MMSTQGDNKKESALHIREGVDPASQVNETILRQLRSRKPEKITLEEYFSGIRKRDRVLLGKAITLVESTLPEHAVLAQELIERCLSVVCDSIRIGVTGVPGAGKSTFIEALGMYLVENGHHVAVLAVDPSSQRSKGSILGDKTRMEKLSAHPNAFIRPTPSSGTLGGVARATRETIILCEAAGYDVIFVETVGVGQSETVVKSMVDFFLLLVLAGAGDELQGMKRGIMEMVDAVIVHKADGDNFEKAHTMVPVYQQALHYFPPTESGWVPRVECCSSLTGYQIDIVWNIISEYVQFTKSNGYFQKNRNLQQTSAFYQTVEESLKKIFFQDPAIQQHFRELETQISLNQITPYKAASTILQHIKNLYGLQ